MKIRRLAPRNRAMRVSVARPDPRPAAGLLLILMTLPVPPTAAGCLGAALRAAPTCCCSPRLFTSGYSYVITPGCEGVDCGPERLSVTEDLEGAFWGLGEGDPRPGRGIDNGTFAALGGWLYTYPGYGGVIISTWAANTSIDGCIDFAFSPRCMAIALSDRSPDTGGGAVAVLTASPDGLGNYDFDQPGDIVLARLPRVRIIASERLADPDRIRLIVSGVSEDDLALGVYLDPACDPPPAIAGYRVYMRTTVSGPPTDSRVESWTPLTGVVPLGDAATFEAACDSDASLFLAYGLEFDSGFVSSHVSEPGTEVSCSPALAEPDDPMSNRDHPRGRERPTGRERFRD